MKWVSAIYTLAFLYNFYDFIWISFFSLMSLIFFPPFLELRSCINCMTSFYCTAFIIIINLQTPSAHVFERFSGQCTWGKWQVDYLFFSWWWVRMGVLISRCALKALHFTVYIWPKDDFCTLQSLSESCISSVSLHLDNPPRIANCRTQVAFNPQLCQEFHWEHFRGIAFLFALHFILIFCTSCISFLFAVLFVPASVLTLSLF